MRGRGDEEEQGRQHPGAPWCLSCCNHSSINTGPPGPLISVMCGPLPWRIQHNLSTCSYRTPYLSVGGIVSLVYCAELFISLHVLIILNEIWSLTIITGEKKLHFCIRFKGVGMVGKDSAFNNWKSLFVNYSYVKVLLNKKNWLVGAWRHFIT